MLPSPQGVSKAWERVPSNTQQEMAVRFCFLTNTSPHGQENSRNKRRPLPHDHWSSWVPCLPAAAARSGLPFSAGELALGPQVCLSHLRMSALPCPLEQRRGLWHHRHKQLPFVWVWEWRLHEDKNRPWYAPHFLTQGKVKWTLWGTVPQQRHPYTLPDERDEAR